MHTYMCIYMNIFIRIIGGPTRAQPIGPKGAHKNPKGPTRARPTMDQGGPQGPKGAHKGPRGPQGPKGPTRARPTRDQRGPQGCKGAHKGPVHRGPAHKGPRKATLKGPRGVLKRARAQALEGPRGPSISPASGRVICPHPRPLLTCLQTTISEMYADNRKGSYRDYGHLSVQIHGK